ncbi:hypothetical protein AX769_13495 [Frondihabitans sp. PAMC 28766]|nr:hypothetical protein AX769_13495 [Frondihabitans sp. PAMC 28766]
MLALAVVILFVAAPWRSEPIAAPPPAATHATSAPAPTPTPTEQPTPPQSSQAALAAVPLAFFDAAIAALPDPATLHPATAWQVATPRAPLVGLYASPGAASPVIAALGSTVPTINRPTAVAVYGTEGGMILISTPSRRTVPGSGAPSAPSATFAWARAADFILTPIDRIVEVDNATSTVSIVTREGALVASEKARLGTPTDPTPAATSTYMEANYVDPRVTYTDGNPISLTGAHSSLLPGFGGNSALTALHYYPDPTGSSHGCVRVSAAMTRALAKLPVGTPIVFS